MLKIFARAACGEQELFPPAPRPLLFRAFRIRRFWRVCRRRYAAEAATGEGARRVGGRWNSRGVRAVYASTSLALAAVETFVNLEPNLQPKDFVSIEGEIPRRACDRTTGQERTSRPLVRIERRIVASVRR